MLPVALLFYSTGNYESHNRKKSAVCYLFAFAASLISAWPITFLCI